MANIDYASVTGRVSRLAAEMAVSKPGTRAVISQLQAGDGEVALRTSTQTFVVGSKAIIDDCLIAAAKQFGLRLPMLKPEKSETEKAADKRRLNGNKAARAEANRKAAIEAGCAGGNPKRKRQER